MVAGEGVGDGAPVEVAAVGAAALKPVDGDVKGECKAPEIRDLSAGAHCRCRYRRPNPRRRLVPIGRRTPRGIGRGAIAGARFVEHA